MTAPIIHRVSTLDLNFTDWSWPFSTLRRAEIDAHFAQKQLAKPQLWNGRILLARNPVFAAGIFTADYFEADFASLLAWIDWGFPDTDVFNGFGMAALRSSDGAYVAGEMSASTANAGRIYFPSGTPDLNDVRGDKVDIAASVVRELEEETGLRLADYRVVEDWQCVVSGSSIAMMRVIDVPMPGEALREVIQGNLAGQASPELSAIHLVRSVGDLTPAMPRYMHAFIEAQPEMAG